MSLSLLERTLPGLLEHRMPVRRSIDWARIERDSGTRLPTDFVELSEAYAPLSARRPDLARTAEPVAGHGPGRERGHGKTRAFRQHESCLSRGLCPRPMRTLGYLRSSSRPTRGK
ncbi:hypothetical protein SSP531S_41560 [Streptomyces spongiicola]|uniref:Uncharacterized protein n=1 Tax=Streptomyces spongiicola TaxID=1690221 RepID=A0A388T173_9ACTN|nr:hypothetical protein SSP531S_41560 [Streptomyces spongiicola]